MVNHLAFEADRSVTGRADQLYFFLWMFHAVTLSFAFHTFAFFNSNHLMARVLLPFPMDLQTQVTQYSTQV